MEVQQHVDDFVGKIQNGDNDSTVERYSDAIRRWLEWCDENGIDVWEADGDNLKVHINHLLAQDYSKSYAKIRRAAVSRFYQECAPDDVTNPSDDLDMKWSELDGYKKETALRDRDFYVTDDEFSQMLEAVPAPETRNKLILRILRRCGLRRGELASLRTRDVDEREQVIRVYREKAEDTVGIPVSDGLMLELSRWRDVGRKTMGGYNPDAEWLFPSEKREKITGKHINKIVKHAAEETGIQESMYTDNMGRDRARVTAHSLRFSAAKELQDKGVDIDKIQTFLGHADISTTEHYLRAREDAMQDAIRDVRD